MKLTQNVTVSSSSNVSNRRGASECIRFVLKLRKRLNTSTPECHEMEQMNYRDISRGFVLWLIPSLVCEFLRVCGLWGHVWSERIHAVILGCCQRIN